MRIPTDAAFRMKPEALRQAIAADRAAGRLPLAVVATVGTTSTASVDPVAAIADICAESGAWLHVDASYAGTAAVVPECRGIFDGVDRADSLVVNPHKWMFTPVDISAMYTRRPDVLKRAFTLVPDYLITAEQDQVVNLMDYGVQLGRRFRALKLWMVIRAFGVSGIIDRLRRHMALAAEFASWVEQDPDAADEANQRILDRVNASGQVYLSHTKLGRFALRLAIGNLRSERRHVEKAWELLRLATISARGDSRGRAEHG